MKIKKSISKFLVLVYLFTLLTPINSVQAAEEYVKATKTVDVTKMTTEQEATVNLKVKGAPPVDEVKPNDVILIIDKSGSMADGFDGCNYYRMNAARESAKTFVNLMDMTKHKVGVVDFSASTVTGELPLTNDRQTLNNYISGIHEGGGTCTADAVRRATRMLSNHRPEAQPVIIILTDGGANDNANGNEVAAFNNAKQAAKEAKDAGIVFYTLALLTQKDDAENSAPSKVMKEMATTKEHHYFAYGKSQLEDNYRKIEQQIKRPSVYNVKIKDVVSPEFEIVPGSADSNIPRPTIVGNEISWNLTEIKDDELNFTYKIRPKKDIKAGSYKVSSKTNVTYKDYKNAERAFDVENPSIEVEHPAPIINSIEANNGEVAGGNEVTIKGEKFRSGLTVTFGDKKADKVTLVNDKEIKVVVPAGVVGNVSVKVINDDKKTAETSYRYWANPTVNTITPQHGKIAGNTEVVIKGTNFAKDIKVKFGNNEAKVTYKDSTELTVYTPAAENSGTVDVTLTNGDGTTSTVKAGFTYDVEYAAPVITSIEKDNGEIVGGNEVTIKGDKFREGATVNFGSVKATKVTLVSENEIKVTVPAGERGTVAVKVTNTDGKFATGKYQYVTTPGITSVEPNHGPIAGNTIVIIKGSNFYNGVNVKFGDKDAVKTIYKNATLIYAMSPQTDKSGAVDINIINEDGSKIVKENGFTYDEIPKPVAPTITTLTPNSGLVTGGDSVTINGTGFQKGIKVTIGDKEAAVGMFYGENSILVKIPQATKAGAVDVKVTNPDAQSATLTGGYTYNELPKPAAPTVTTLTPNSGLVTGGGYVVIDGTGFQKGIKVTIGDKEAAVANVYGENQMRIVIPQATKAGVVDVKVTNPDGQNGILAAAYTYCKLPEPSITSITPNSGLLEAGNVVTITGKEFQIGAAVKIGDLDGEKVTVTDSTKISVKIPKSTKAGVVDVVVTNPDGQGATLIGGYTYNEPPKPAAPTITSLSQNNGKLAGGDLVTINGTGFQSGMKATIGGIEAKIANFYKATMVRVMIPVGAKAGATDLIVTNPDGQNATLTGGYTYNEPPKAAAPTITSLSKNSGLIAGGDLVTINGTGFQSGLKATIGGIEANIASFNGATSFKVTIPVGAKLGTTDIIVTNPDGQSAQLTGGYTYNEPPKPAAPTITSLSENSGLITGGNLLTISGTGFTTGLKVTIGGIEAKMANFYGVTMVRVMVPAATSGGPVDVEIINPDGQKATLNGAYTYVIPQLEINSLSATSGDISGKYTLSLYGKNFSDKLEVTVDGVPVTVSYRSSGYITIVSMPAAKTPGVVPIVVKNILTGQTASINYTYNPKPAVPVCVITSLDTTSGPTTGGRYIYIKGSNFSQKMKFMIDGKEAPIVNFYNTTYFRTITSAHAAGKVNIVIINEEGKESNSVEYEFK